MYCVVVFFPSVRLEFVVCGQGTRRRPGFQIPTRPPRESHRPARGVSSNHQRDAGHFVCPFDRHSCLGPATISPRRQPQGHGGQEEKQGECAENLFAHCNVHGSSSQSGTQKWLAVRPGKLLFLVCSRSILNRYGSEGWDFQDAPQAPHRRGFWLSRLGSDSIFAAMSANPRTNYEPPQDSDTLTDRRGSPLPCCYSWPARTSRMLRHRSILLNRFGLRAARRRRTCLSASGPVSSCLPGTGYSAGDGCLPLPGLRQRPFPGRGAGPWAPRFLPSGRVGLTSRLQPGVNVVTFEVAGYNVNSYYLLDQPSFLQAEIVADGKVLGSTDGPGFRSPPRFLRSGCKKCSAIVSSAPSRKSIASRQVSTAGVWMRLRRLSRLNALSSP